MNSLTDLNTGLTARVTIGPFRGSLGATVNQPSSTRRLVSFGAFRCDLTARELHKNGIKVKMADQPFHLLAMLLERPGEVVTRQELEQELWPGQTELDRADNLNTAIKKVRTALDDEAERPRFIETLPRRGYCFIGHIENGDSNGNGSSPAAIQDVGPMGVAAPREPAPSVQLLGTQRSPQYVFRKWKRAAVASATVTAALFAYWWFTPLPRPRVTRIDQITFSARVDTPVKPVDDGQHIYYIRRAGDHWDLMATVLGEGDGRRIDAPGKSAMVLDVSPNRTRLLVATFEKRDGNDPLWIMPSEGGAANRLGVITPSAAFSPDGKWIAYANRGGIFLMDADGLNQHKLADPGVLATWISWSPDGQRLRFTIGPSDGSQSIWEISRLGQDLHELPLKTTEASSVCCGTWMNGGGYYVFAADVAGRWDVWAVREQSSWRRHPWHAVQLTFGPNSAVSPAAAVDGRHILYYSGVLRQRMQRFDLHSRNFVPLRIGNESLLSYSRDGRWIAYVDAQTHALIRSRTDGSERLDLSSSEVNPEFPRWSPDGRWIAFQGRAADRAGALYIVAATGGPVQRLLANEKNLGDVDWSSDGRRLVASHGLRGGDDDESELLIIEFATQRAERIPGSDHLAASRWSPDGRYISATSADQTQLKLFDASTNRWQVIAHGEALGISVWSPDGHYLYFQDLLGSGEQLRRYDVNKRVTETVVDFSGILNSGVSRCGLMGVMPDGSPIVEFNRSDYDLFSAEVSLP